jgi:hypothetical protein
MAGLTERVVGEGEVEARRRWGLWLLGCVRSLHAEALREVTGMLVLNSLPEALTRASASGGYKTNRGYGELEID